MICTSYTSRVIALAAVCAAGVGMICASAPSPAAAQTVTIDHVRTYLNSASPGSPDPNNIISIYFDPSYTAFASGGLMGTEYVGAQTVTLSGPGVPAGPFQAYCVNLMGEVGTTPYSASMLPASDLANGNPSVPLSVRGGGIDWLVAHTAVTSDIQSAALQLAVWKAEYDWDGQFFSSLSQEPALSFFAGNFQYNTMPYADLNTQVTILKTANSILTQWGGQTSDLSQLLNTTEVSAPDVGGTPTLRQSLMTHIAPEPGSGSLLLTCLPAFAGLHVRARRRRARPQS